MTKWAPPILAALIAFVGGIVVAILAGWQSRRTALETRVLELERAFQTCQAENEKLRRRVGEVERVLRAFRGYADDA